MLCQHENRRTAPRMMAFQAIVLPAMLAPCVSALRAAEPGKPSRTAMLVLQMRALGAKLPDPDLRNPDTLAGRFFGTRERRVLAEVNDPIFADLDFDEAWAKMRHSRRTFLHVLARTRAIDDTVRESLRGGATQVVILGAGYDSRAYRMQGPRRGATVFQVDLPPMQELKKRRVREVLGRAPETVVFVPIDLATEDLGPALRKAGYRRDSPSRGVRPDFAECPFIRAAKRRYRKGWGASPSLAGAGAIWFPSLPRGEGSGVRGMRESMHMRLVHDGGRETRTHLVTAPADGRETGTHLVTAPADESGGRTHPIVRPWSHPD
jgi:Leucine carboxyl methyltransferase